MIWLISANGKMYDHARSFAHFGSIDWRQGNVKYSTGDTVYIYCTRPIKKIRYKCTITALNKKSSEIRDDKDYWINPDEYAKSLGGKFLNLELVDEVDTEKLSLSQLLNNGLKAAPQSPLKLTEKLESYINSVFRTANDEDFPETIKSSPEIFEGIKKQVTVNKYERSSNARTKCIEANGGYICKVCSFDFKQVYGALGNDFIHVHHIVPIHTIGRSYKINYETDLIPVCPNCHAMLHKEIAGKSYTVSELKELVESRKKSYEAMP
jgi:5-methylcytosine-specific restriction enzyme A